MKCEEGKEEGAQPLAEGQALYGRAQQRNAEANRASRELIFRSHKGRGPTTPRTYRSRSYAALAG